jgi:hypothetical protein
LAPNAFERECVLFFSEIVQLFGVPKSVGQIYGLLYASPEPLSFSDIVERLDISKGSASQGLQLLRSLGAINVAMHPSPFSNPESEIQRSVARDYFEPELSLRKLVGGVLSERLAPLATTGAERLNRLRELAEQDGEGNDFYLDRAKQLNTWRRRLKTVLPVLTVLLSPKRGK